MSTGTKVNYSKQYKNNFPEFDLDSVYFVVEVDAGSFDEYWAKKAYLKEHFSNALDCSRREKYYEILNEIKSNPNHQIAYPIISYVNEKNIKMSQGRHRIRAIIDSGATTLQIAVKEEHVDILKSQIDIKIIDKFVF